MTSLSETYLSCKTAMASRLNSKGITSASATDGLTTLINYIDDINQFNDGVFLASDKKIGQSSNTVHLSAMVVDDGMFKVGEPVIIEDKVNTTPIYTKTKNNENPLSPDELNDSIGSGRWALVFGTYSGSGTDTNVYFKNVDDEWFSVTKTSTGFTIDSNLIPESGSGWIGGDLTGTILYYCDGRIFTDTGDSLPQFYGGYGHRDYGTVQYLEGTISLYKIYGGGITEDSGTVAGIYTCSGAGKKEIVAKSGSVVSQPVEVWDTIFSLLGTSDTGNWTIFNTVTVEYSSDGTHFIDNGSGSQAMDLKVNDNLKPFDGTKDLTFEFDFKTANAIDISIRDNSGTRRTVVSHSSTQGFNAWKHYKWEYNHSTKKVSWSVDGGTATETDLSSYTLTNIGFAIVDWNGDVDCWIKNFHLYNG